MSWAVREMPWCSRFTQPQGTSHPLPTPPLTAGSALLASPSLLRHLVPNSVPFPPSTNPLFIFSSPSLFSNASKQGAFDHRIDCVLFLLVRKCGCLGNSEQNMLLIYLMEQFCFGLLKMTCLLTYPVPTAPLSLLPCLGPLSRPLFFSTGGKPPGGAHALRVAGDGHAAAATDRSPTADPRR